MPVSKERQDRAGWAGIAQVLINALGGAAKYAVIVAGLLIALYFFLEQQNKIASESAKARQEAEKISEQKLESVDKRLQNAQAQLLTTYHEFQEIGSRQVNNLKEVLALREVVDKQNRDKLAEIQKLEDRQRQDEQELSLHKVEVQRLTEELDKKQTVLSKRTDELNARQNQIDKVLSNFEQKRHELEEASRSRLKQTETYNLVKDKLIDLATKVENAKGEINSDTKMLAGEILRAVQNVDESLKDFIRIPKPSNFASLRPILIGMPRTDFEKIDFKTLGVLTFVCIEGKDNNACVILVSQNENYYTNILAVSFEKDLVVETLYFEKMLAIKLHAIDDWNKDVLAIRMIGAESSIQFLGFVSESWTLARALESDPDLQKEQARIRVIFDEGRPVKSLNFTEYRGLLPDDYDLTDKEKYGGAAVSFAMEKRAAKYPGVRIGRGIQIPSEILEGFNKVAKAAIQRSDRSTLVDLLAPSLDSAFLGRLAAVLLKRDFQIIRYQANVNDANSAAIVAEYHPTETGSETRTATFRFDRAAVGAPWRLAGMDIATS